MTIPDHFYCSHPATRLILGGGLLCLAVLSQSVWMNLMLMAVTTMALRLLDGGWLTITRLIGLLRWFVIPILLLHALLSPGQLLIPGFIVAISREGLMQGMWLSLHLASVFFAAVIMFRLLKYAEWLHAFHLLPWVGKHLSVYILIMISMKKSISDLLQQLRSQFGLRKSWLLLPGLLIAAFRQTLADASEYAQMLWLRWPGSVNYAMAERADVSDQSGLLFSLICAAGGCACFILAWL